MADKQLEQEWPEVVTPDGEVVDSEQVAFAYTREGRRVIGKEFPNPVPLEPPIGFVPQKPLHEQIRDMVQSELSRRAEEAGDESFEDSDDFDVGDDFDPSSPYELDYEPTEPWPGNAAVRSAEEAAIAAKSGGEGGPSPPSQSPSPEAAEPPPAKPS